MKRSAIFHDGEVKIWQKWKTIMKMKPSVLNFAEDVRLIPGLKESYYSAPGVKAVPQNRNRAAIAAPAMSGINTI